jgi:hypothetical protein
VDSLAPGVRLYLVSAVCLLAPEGMRGPPQLILNALKMDSTIETLHYVRQVANQITK